MKSTIVVFDSSLGFGDEVKVYGEDDAIKRDGITYDKLTNTPINTDFRRTLTVTEI